MNKVTHITLKAIGRRTARLIKHIGCMSLGALLFASPVHTKERAYSSSTEMRARVEQAAMQYLQVQTQGYPGKVKIQLKPLNSDIKLQLCEQLESFSTGGRLWGRAHIGVRCRDGDQKKAWTLYLQADIQVFGKYAVLAHPLNQGQVLQAQNVVMQTGDLTRLPNSIITDINIIEGKLANINLSAGMVLRQELFKATNVIEKGQTVQLSSIGNGFVVSTDGTAINAAQAGQVVQVKVSNGQTIKGIAKDIGKVEVAH